MKHTSDCGHCRNGVFPQEYFQGAFGRYCPACDREISASVGRMRDAKIDVECVNPRTRTEAAMDRLVTLSLLALILIGGWRLAT